MAISRGYRRDSFPRGAFHLQCHLFATDHRLPLYAKQIVWIVAGAAAFLVMLDH